MRVIVRRKVIRGFQMIPNRAAVKFTQKDKYFVDCKYRKRSTRSWWEQVMNSNGRLFCLVHGVLQKSKAKYVCCGSTKAVNRNQVVLSFFSTH